MIATMRWLFGCAVVLLLAAAVVVLWEGPAPESAGDAREPAQSAERAPDAAQWNGLPQAQPPPSAEIGRSAVAATPAAAEPQWGTPLPEGEGMLVRVISAETGQPIAAAEVLVADIDEEDMPRVQSLLLETRDVEAVLEALSVVYRTGADGTVRVPAVGGEGAVAARKGSLFGVAREQVRGRAEIEIACAPSTTVSALVVDEQDHPVADAPVALRVLRDHGSHTPLALRTDARGIARFRRPELFLAEPGVTGAALALDGPIGALVEQAFDPAAPPETPLRLAMPAYGSVAIEVRSASGELWSEPAVVSIAEHVAGRPEERLEFTSGGTIPLQAGAARYQPVGLGLSLEARAVRLDGGRIGATVAPGPLRPGEVARVVIQESLEYARLTGRLVDQAGAAIAGAQVFAEVITVHDGRSDSNGSGFRTDSAGRFRIELSQRRPPPGGTRRLRLREQSERGVSGRGAEIALDRELPPGETDLGDVVLARAGLLVAGIVVDEHGEPMAACRVQVQDKRRYGKGEDEWYWNYLDQGFTETGAKGEFALHAETEAAEIQVMAFARDMWCEGVVVAPGSVGVAVVVRPGAQLAGRVLLDADAKPESFFVRLKLLAPEGDTPWHGFPLDARGGFELTGLRPGRYDLDLVLRDANEPLLLVQGLLLVPGANADARLDPLDARGRTGSFSVRASGPDGGALREFTVWRLRADGRATLHSARDGVVLIPLSEGAADLAVEADGCLRAQLTRVSSDQSVRLRAGPRVRVTVVNQHEIPADCRVSVGLRPAGDQEAGFHGVAPKLADSSGAVEWTASALGAHEVFVLLQSTGEFPRYFGVQHDLSRIEVGAGGGSYSLRITQESLDRALEAIRNGE